MQWHQHWLHKTLFVDNHPSSGKWQSRSPFKGSQRRRKIFISLHTKELVPEALNRQLKWRADSVANRQCNSVETSFCSESQSTADRNKDRFFGGTTPTEVEVPRPGIQLLPWQSLRWQCQILSHRGTPRNWDRFEQKNHIENETTLTPNSSKWITAMFPPEE